MFDPAAGNALVYIEYENADLKAKYMMIIKQNGSDLWLCHYGAVSNVFDSMYDLIIASAKTIRFDK